MPTGIAIHVGLNNPRIACCALGQQLTEAENGAREMNLLTPSSPFEKRHPLLGVRARRDRLRPVLRKAQQKLGRGDFLLLTFSGHGCQEVDSSGATRDEPDRYDETWCLDDGQLRDDELFSLLTGFVDGVQIFVISSSCHSGSMLFRVRGRRPRPVSGEERAALLARLSRTRESMRTERRGPDPLASIRDLELPLRVRPVRPGVNILFLSSCSEGENARDGVFMPVLLKLLREGSIPTYVELIRELHTRVSNNNGAQHPGWFLIGPPDMLLQRPFLFGPQPPSRTNRGSRGSTANHGPSHR